MYVFRDDKILVSLKDSLKNNSVNTINFDLKSIKNKKSVVFSSELFPDNWRSLPQWCAVDSKFKYNKGEFIDLRQVWHIFGYDEFLKAGGAWQFYNWFLSVKLCSSCGGILEPNEHDFGRHCVNCGKTFYAPLSPAVIVAVTHDKKLLLSHNNAMINELYTVTAGFVEPGETLEQAVMREVSEEVGVKIKNIKYFGSQPWPFPHSLMIGFTAEYESGELKPDGVEIGAADWFSAEEINAKLKANLIKIPDGASIARRLIENFLNLNN